MTPGALRDWIPAHLHGELAAVGPVVSALLVATPSPFVGVWPSHLLAAIAEREVAPWLGGALFLGSDPLAQAGNFRLWDEERDWNRHAVLLADLARRFGEPIRAPLAAIPAPLRPRIVTDWLGPEPGEPEAVDRRLVEAEDALYRGVIGDALAALLRLWRECGDPLLADVIDVIDTAAGAPLPAPVAAAVWSASPEARGDLDVGASLRAGVLSGGANPEALLAVMRHHPPDPRVATAVRALLLARDLSRSAVTEAAEVLLRVGDVRGLARVAWDHRLPAAPAAGMWTAALGPAARGRLRAMARRVGGNVEPRGPALAALELAAWTSTGADRGPAVAVLGDALRERGDARVPALGPAPLAGQALRALPPRALEALCDRPFGLRAPTATFVNGVLYAGEPLEPEVAILDPAWQPVEQLTQVGWRPELAATLPHLHTLLLHLPAGASPEAGAELLASVNAGRSTPLRVVGDDTGLFATVPGEHAAVVLRKVTRLRQLPQPIRVRHLALTGSLDLLAQLEVSAPPALRRITLAEGGVALCAPVGWCVEVRLDPVEVPPGLDRGQVRSRSAVIESARWYGSGPPSPAIADFLREHRWFTTLSVGVPGAASTADLRRRLQPLGVRVTTLPPPGAA